MHFTEWDNTIYMYNILLISAIITAIIGALCTAMNVYAFFYNAKNEAIKNREETQKSQNEDL
jgi:hypothetical protein